MKKILLLIVLSWLTATLQAQMVSVSTNALMDGLMMPNLGVELSLGRTHTAERSTLGLHAFGTSEPWGRDIKAWGLQPEYRYYFSGRAMHREFVGLGALATTYDVTWAGKVYNGNAVGVGLIFGYVWNLTQRLNVDFHAGFGSVFYRQKEYFVGDYYDEDYSVSGVVRTNAHGYTLLPTSIGISVAYILK